MKTQRNNLVAVLTFVLVLQTTFGFEDDEVRESNDRSSKRPPRVDAEIKRPYRICQGFEDPEEIDCYMRSDIKLYVCTEPSSFNPCESEVRVTTYHYDHIKHRCNKVNVPACDGQIIRTMTLIQCLIYCHSKDPFSLGKSTSMVYKLNQKKPLVTKNEDVQPSEKSINFVNDKENTDKVIDLKSTVKKEKKIEKIVKVLDKKATATVVKKTDDAKKMTASEKELEDFVHKLKSVEKKDTTHSEDLKSLELEDEDPEERALNEKESENKKSSKAEENIEDVKDFDEKESDKIEERALNEKDNENKKSSKAEENIEDVKDFDEKESDKIEERALNEKDNEKTKSSKAEENIEDANDFDKKENDKIEEVEITDNSLRRNEENKKEMAPGISDDTHRSDSKDQSADDGFYLWDE